MNKKQAFIKVLYKNNIKISPEHFVNSMERVFSRYFNKNVWSINDEKEFFGYYNDLIKNNRFKIVNFITYKRMVSYGKYYGLFLSKLTNLNNAIKKQNKQKSVIGNQDKKTVIFNPKYANENIIIAEFCGYEDFSKVFYKLFEYSKEKIPGLELETRDAIMGAKLKNERLRFYVDKKGILHITQIEFKSLDLHKHDVVSIEKYFKDIDCVNEYFLSHPEAVHLSTQKPIPPKAVSPVPKDDAIGYVYHKKFGFGKIVSQTDKIIIVLFDKENETKNIEKGHPSYIEITFEDYVNKNEPVFPQKPTVPVPEVDSQSMSIEEIDPVLRRLQNRKNAKEYTVRDFEYLADWSYCKSHGDGKIFRKYRTRSGHIIECDSKGEYELIKYLDRPELTFDVGGQNICIEYFTGIRYAKYYPDFVIITKDGHIAFIEVKPVTAMSYHLNISKYKYLKKYCEKNGYEYMMFDPTNYDNFEDHNPKTYDDLLNMRIPEIVEKCVDEYVSKRLDGSDPLFKDDDVPVLWDLLSQKHGKNYKRNQLELYLHALVIQKHWYNKFENGFMVYKAIEIDGVIISYSNPDMY